MARGKKGNNEAHTSRRSEIAGWSRGAATPRSILPPMVRTFLTALGLSLLALPLVLTLDPILGPLGAVILVCAGGLLGLHPISRRVLYGAFGAMALVVAVVVFTPAIEGIEGWLDVGERPQNADAIVILGGNINCRADDLTADSLSRLVRGLELWRQGFAPRVTVSEAGEAIIGVSCGNVSTISRRTIGRLYPDGGPEVVDLPKVKNTRDEAEATARIARARGWKRVLVVTSPTHTRRARATFRDAGLDAIAISSSEPRYDTGFRLPFDRVRSLEAIGRELAGLVKYGASGWL